jgi:hypothetical protein
MDCKDGDANDGVPEPLLCWPRAPEHRNAHKNVFNNPIFRNPVVVPRSMFFSVNQLTNMVEHVSCHRETLACSGIAEKLAGGCAISGAARADLSYPESGTAKLRLL